MASIAIDRMKVRYRMPPEAAGALPRLKRAMADVLDHELESAMERVGIEPGGQLCIRELHAIARLRVRDPDSLLTARLSQAILDAIRGAMREGVASAIHYGSRALALSDVAASAPVGDFARSWAWAQMGLWPADSPMSAEAASKYVLRVLVREARYAPAVLAYLTGAKRVAFATLVKHGASTAWTELARAAIAASGSTLNTTEAAHGEIAAAAVEAIALRIAGSSAIARAAMAEARALPMATTTALATLAVLEVEPAVIRHGFQGSRAMLASVARAIVGAGAAALDSLSESPPGSPRPLEDVSPTPDRTEASARGAASTDASGERVLEHARWRDSGRDPVVEVSPVGGRKPSSRPVDGAIDQEPRNARRQAITQSGGLLYLINLANRISLPEMLLRDHRLTERGPRWALNRIASALAGIEPSDPAALAFAGLSPDAEPPGARTSHAADAELAAIEEYRRALLKALRDLLDRVDGTEASLADFVFRRRAEVVADPGWIEAHFSLADVSAEIRRAGLDLNPDWVPWLGVVVRFVYA